MLRTEKGNGKPQDLTPKLSQVGAFLVVVATPLVFFPISFGPFLDLKLVVVVAGASLLFINRGRTDRALARSAAVWMLMVSAASILGVDLWFSILGPEQQGSGLLLVGTSASLLIAGSAFPITDAKRLNKWLVVTALIVSSVAVAARLAPEHWTRLPPGLSLADSTVGQRVVVDAVAAAGIAAALGSGLQPLPLAATTLVFASAMGSGGGRLGWISALAGLGIVALKRQDRRRRPLAACLMTMTATFALWTTVATLTSDRIPSSAQQFGRLGEGSPLSRAFMYSGALRAALRRPILGWGPGNTSGAWLSSASRQDTGIVSQRVGDAHNLFLESLVTTGFLGLLALLVLGSIAVVYARRGPPEATWAAGAAAALFAYHMFQPMNVVATPLMFFLAGIAARREPGREPPRKSVRPTTRLLLLAVVALILLLTTLRAAASVFEQVGRSYFSPWSLEQSLRLEPRRASAAQALALSLALDGRGGDAVAAARARKIIEKTVAHHPWHAKVRLTAAEVETLLRNNLGTRLWLERHRSIFPNDPVFRGTSAQ